MSFRRVGSIFVVCPFIYFYLFLNQVTRLSVKLLGGNLWDEEVCLKETGKKKIFFKSAPRGRCSSLSQKEKKKRREKKKSTPVIVLRAGSRRRLELFLETLESLQTASSP